jgi:hypothetical protein
MILLFIFLQWRKFGRPYDSMTGMPPAAGWIALIIIGYIVLRVGIKIKKDKEKEE